MLKVNLTFTYKSGFTLKKEIELGQGISIISGPSGCGKTTLLKLISGLLTPSQGQISLNGEILFDSTTKICLPTQKRAVGHLFQESLIFPHLSVKENLLFGSKYNLASNHSLDEILEVLELGELINRLPNTLSGGQARRVALGRALLANPKLLLLDEPFNGLDSKLKENTLEYLIKTHKKWQLPLIIVSHDPVTSDSFHPEIFNF
jgi:molybdate transport system ATP-binding protein